MSQPNPRHPTEERPIRLFFMADHLGYTGTDRVHGGTTYFLNTLPALQQAGLEMTACFMQPRHPAAQRLEAAGLKVTFLGLSKTSPRSINAFVPLLRECRADVMHLHSLKSHIAGRRAARRFGIPAVVHVHDQVAITGPVGWLLRRQGPKTDCLIGITDSVTEYALNNYAVPRERAETVLDGMNAEPFLESTAAQGSAVRSELNVPHDAPVIATVGRVIDDKGQHKLLEAMPSILKRLPETRLLVVGDGPMRATCEKMAESLGISHRVVFTGQRGDIPAVLRAIDVLVMPSMWEEGFGYAALEAMLSERPVVAFRTGGLQTIVKPDETGLVVERGDLDGLSDAVVRLLSDEALRARLARNGRDMALRYSPQQHVAQLCEVYRGVIQKHVAAAQASEQAAAVQV